MKRHSRFWRVYDRLSEQGRCDAPGGMEYQRVRQEWIAAGRPRPIAAFIRKRANAWPTIKTKGE